ncbi:similar to RNA binding protein gene with multiple splicing (predicted), isoform CRA_h [Rattus norvegicus]|uniref:Similar to RNA binding protein gene with multiple splicing (Predicted), isoform CRA_h n=1 Tax=Rattus norvegicus TaxID=10116 RepID=A6IVS0_RAT|nr:similar to RNA binding protein gene with multiple splicing (predicted), isoform CRA_h [Rattus norvegicus]
MPSVSLQRQSPTHLSFVHFFSKLDLSLGMCLSRINPLQTNRGSSHVEFISKPPLPPFAKTIS